MSANSRGSLSAAFLLLLGTCSSAVWSGRPLTVDDANVNEPGHAQLEAWVARAGGSTVYNVAPAYAPVDGLEIGALLAGAVLTETVFAWPGMGTWLVDAIRNRDYPVLQGGILFIAIVFVLVNLIVDISYGLINPRIRVS